MSSYTGTAVRNSGTSFLPDDGVPLEVLSIDVNGQLDWVSGVLLGSTTPAGAINIAASGTNQNITLTPSGTGFNVFEKNIRLADTVSADVGVIYKGADRFIHNFYETGSVGINTFVGVEAGNLTSITTGGGATTLGSFNTGIGAHSLQYLTTGFNNTGLGENTLNVNTSGANNTAVGAGCMIGNLTGGQNVAVGVQGLYTNTTGSENTAVGYLAGLTSDPANGNVSGTQNVWIGSRTGPGSTSQLTNSIFIGYAVTGTASNQIILGNASHTSTILRGDILVGATTSNTGKLQVTSTTGAQLTAAYDTSNYLTVTTGSTGTVLFQAEGTDAAFRFLDEVGINSAPQAANSLTVENDVANGVGIRVSQIATSGNVNGIFATATGAATENIAGKFSATGATTNYAIQTVAGISVFGAQMGSTPTTVATLGVGATTFAVASNVATVTGDGGGNTVATITGGIPGMRLTLIFTDANVTITDTDANTANTIDLSAAFTSSARDTLTLVHNGTKWFETARSVN